MIADAFGGLGVAAMLLTIAAEFWCRAYVFNPNRAYLRRPGSWGIFRPSPEGTPGITEDAHVTINRHGLRGSPASWSDSWRVLVFGGSTVEDNLLNDAETWVGCLQTRLRARHKRTWVGNAGRSGANARHHAMQLERLTLPKADLVVVLCGLNDLLYDFHIHHPFQMPETWDEHAAFGYLPPKGTVSALQTALQRRPANPVFPLGDQIAAFKARRARVQGRDWVTAMPPMEKALLAYRANLHRIADAIEAKGAKVAFVTQPALWNETMSPTEHAHLFAGGTNSPATWATNEHTPWFSAPLLGRMLDRYNEAMRNVCRERGVPCLDLAACLPRAVKNYIDDFHFSRAGARNVAQIVERKILDNGLAPRSVRANVRASFDSSIYPVW